MKKIVILGATGVIGQKALELIANDPNLTLVGFSFHNNNSLAQDIIDQFKPKYTFSKQHPSISNVDSWQELLVKTQPDLVVHSVTGFAGVEMTQYCMVHHYKLALANKESLVVAGHLLDLNLILPIDSEHSALYELTHKYHLHDINKIYLTASGGPFYKWTQHQLANVSFAQAIDHPTWTMGYKISLDSATLINKCFEMIEAYYLFKTPHIFALYHPHACVHGLIATNNGAVISYMSYPDMKLPIDLALHDYAISSQAYIPDIDFTNQDLHFELITPELYAPIKWVQWLIKKNNPTIGVIITIVDDYVIELFKNNKISFLMITSIIEDYILKYQDYKTNTWSDIYNLRDTIMSDLNASYPL